MCKKNPFVIVVGNYKGGCGKTTVSFHLLITLLYKNFLTTTIDLDYDQHSLTRYIENRITTLKNSPDLIFPLPSEHIKFQKTKSSSDLNVNNNTDEKKLLDIIDNCKRKNVDFILIDTAGSSTYISEIAHSLADLVITPINDSFVDLDTIAIINHENFDLIRPGNYTNMLWKQKIKRLSMGLRPFNWVILTNRLSSLDAKNKQNITLSLQNIQKKMGFRYVNGFSERVIFRELFLYGLTVIDMLDGNTTIKPTISHLSARKELKKFFEVSLGKLPAKKYSSQYTNQSLDEILFSV